MKMDPSLAVTENKINTQLLEIHQPDKNYKCHFCHKDDINTVEWGQMFYFKNITVHYFCLLFSAGLVQRGKDSDDILGFLHNDIIKEHRRGQKLKCKICKLAGATVGCSVKNCKQSYHYPCGYEADYSFKFMGNYESHCKDHREGQNIPVEDELNSLNCLICFELVPTSKCIWPPCCKKVIFHRACMMNHARSSGLHHFKCPSCQNDKPLFKDSMKKLGIFIPDQDASWETEQDAYRDLNERYSKCDAIECLCPDGRDYHEEDDDDNENPNIKTKQKIRVKKEEWKIERCSTCASSAVHLKCGNLLANYKKGDEINWICLNCDIPSGYNDDLVLDGNELISPIVAGLEKEIPQLTTALLYDYQLREETMSTVDDDNEMFIGNTKGQNRLSNGSNGSGSSSSGYSSTSLSPDSPLFSRSYNNDLEESKADSDKPLINCRQFWANSNELPVSSLDLNNVNYLEDQNNIKCLKDPIDRLKKMTKRSCIPTSPIENALEEDNSIILNKSFKLNVTSRKEEDIFEENSNNTNQTYFSNSPSPTPLILDDPHVDLQTESETQQIDITEQIITQLKNDNINFTEKSFAEALSVIKSITNADLKMNFLKKRVKDDDDVTFLKADKISIISKKEDNDLIENAAEKEQIENKDKTGNENNFIIDDGNALRLNEMTTNNLNDSDIIEIEAPPLEKPRPVIIDLEADSAAETIDNNTNNNKQNITSPSVQGEELEKKDEATAMKYINKFFKFYDTAAETNNLIKIETIEVNSDAEEEDNDIQVIGIKNSPFKEPTEEVQVIKEISPKSEKEQPKKLINDFFKVVDNNNKVKNATGSSIIGPEAKLTGPKNKIQTLTLNDDEDDDDDDVMFVEEKSNATNNVKSAATKLGFINYNHYSPYISHDYWELQNCKIPQVKLTQILTDLSSFSEIGTLSDIGTREKKIDEEYNKPSSSKSSNCKKQTRRKRSSKEISKENRKIPKYLNN